MLAGIDIGTTGCKITVYDTKGKYLFKAYQSYETIRNDSTCEIRALDIFEGVKKILKEATSKYQIDAIGIDSFGESFVMLDSNDKPLCNIITYTDSRGQKEIDELVNKLTNKRIREITGLNAHTMFSIGKIMWIKNNEKEIYDKAKHILLMEDFIVYMLTGNAIIDYSLAVRTLAFDINTLNWSNEIFDAANIDMNLFSKPMVVGSKAGKIKESIKKELGITNDIEMVLAGHDQIACAIGAGIFDNNKAVDGAGTVECITAIFDGMDYLETMAKDSLAVVPYLNKGQYITYAFSYTSGSLVDWFKNNFAENETFEELEKGFKAHPTGLLVLPHFAGAATPYMDNDSKGSIVGLTLETNKSILYQAILEGIVYEMKVNFDSLAKAHIRPKYLVATGGGANSLTWLQIKADVLNVKIIRLTSNEAGSRGCAMVAAVASNLYSSLNEAAKAMIHKKEIIKPNKEKHLEYMEVYKRYKKLYKATKGLL